ncbi:MAG: M48 family metallopeptidase [Candidatus Kariarchaeaceae archaeon]
MDLYQRTRIKRVFAILAIVFFEIIHIFFILKITVSSSETGYNLDFRDDLALNSVTILYFILAPLLFAYLSNMSNSSRPDLIQIIGPRSLLRAVNNEFLLGDFRGLEKSEENINLYFAKIAQGEPVGTINNLKMLYATGMLMRDLLEQTGVKSIKRVYVSDSDVPNTFTVRALPVPIIGQDWIIINRRLVEILTPLELRAMVAHEVGHAANFDSWINVFITSPRLIILFGWSIIYFRLISVVFIEGLTIIRFLICVIFFTIVPLSLFLIQRLTNLFQRNAELIADHYSAKINGSEVVVNALLKVAQRALLDDYWKSFDLDDNNYLSNDEISLLADHLRKNPTLRTSPRLPIEYGIVLDDPSHPHIYDRILFINDTLIITS